MALSFPEVNTEAEEMVEEVRELSRLRILERIDGNPRLAHEVLNGQVVVVRRALQTTNLYNQLRLLTMEAISACLGPVVAAQVNESGFERLHEFVAPEDLPGLTEAVYERVHRIAPEIVGRLMQKLLGWQSPFFFESEPNVRFHIPYDIASSHKKQFDQYALTRGQGKLSAHGPHRDQWLDCPENAINIWVAVGPIVRGNGLTIFVNQYKDSLSSGPNGELHRREPLSKPVTFDLEAGDLVLFHGKHLHGSELNRTQNTRFALSFRVTLPKPNFLHNHYHTYLFSTLAGGPWRRLAHLPAELQISRLRTVLKCTLERLLSKLGKRAKKTLSSIEEEPLPMDAVTDLTAIAVGLIKPISTKRCAARVSADRLITFDRFCPHQKADLSRGYISDGAIVCAWHNLSFDAKTGLSACQSLQPLNCREVDMAIDTD